MEDNLDLLKCQSLDDIVSDFNTLVDYCNGLEERISRLEMICKHRPTQNQARGR